jgi:S-DNA-T family DNA segregation ATPase FtsK/SpoIIIE
MAEDGIVGQYNGSQAREILITMDQWMVLSGQQEDPEVAAAPKPKRNRVKITAPVESPPHEVEEEADVVEEADEQDDEGQEAVDEEEDADWSEEEDEAFDDEEETDEVEEEDEDEVLEEEEEDDAPIDAKPPTPSPRRTRSA